LTIIAFELSRLAEESAGDYSVVVKAECLLMERVIPDNITPRVVERYIRKAYQSRAWYFLPRIDKLILILARRFQRVKSPKLKSVLKRIFLAIELHTVRGKARLYGLVMAFKNSLYELEELLRDLTKVLIIGLFYLNNPPAYRVYG